MDYVNGVDVSNGYCYTLRSRGFDTNLTIHARPGYDVTGVGTPYGADFLSALSS